MARKKIAKRVKAKRPQAKVKKVAPGRTTPESMPLVVPQPWVTTTLTERSRLQKAGLIVNPFTNFQKPAPGVLPKGVSPRRLAMDENFAVNAWAAQAAYNGAWVNGIAFMGYPYLSELAQRPEYRRISEVLATEATRKWIKLKTKSKQDKDDPDARTKAKAQGDKIKELEAELTRLDVQGRFRKMIELDGFFGRGHLYIDTGSTDEPKELMTAIGDGRDAVTVAKFGGQKGFLKALRPIEPVWCYPAKYNANDPMKEDWYNPQSWFCLGKEIHVSRLLTFVGREVPDMLKPAYQFGGLSLSQLAKPYVDNWLRTRQAVADLIWTFSVMVLSTDLGTLGAENGQKIFERAALFSNLRTNQGLMLVNKDAEELDNIAVPLGSLDSLQAQSQEQMCSVTGTPVIKLLGIQPAGLNASSQGELTAWGEWVAAFQEKFMDAPLGRVIDLAMMNIWGEVDENITHEWLPLTELTEVEAATVEKTKADTDVALVGGGILDPTESRERLAGEVDGPYSGIDVDDVPEAPMGEEDDGFQSQMDMHNIFNRDPEEPRREDDDEPRREEEPAARAGRITGPRGARVKTGEGTRARLDKVNQRGSRPREPREFSAE